MPYGLRCLTRRGLLAGAEPSTGAIAYWKDSYEDNAFGWNREVVYYRLNPHWTTLYAPDLDKLTGT
ncbi:hypothetical protein A3L22_28010 [Streptomyces griseus subsp. griseus]|nr:hypothetical protein A3L22_28010 [Streptomyces griseus subsp. griseus]